MRAASYWTAGVLFDSAQHIDLPPQQRGVGLLFQNYALFPNMTVEQNVLCGLKAEKDKAARQGPLRRNAAGHAAGIPCQALPGPAFRRTAAAHRAWHASLWAGPKF